MLARTALLSLMLIACSSANSTGIPPVECPPEGTMLTYANFGEELFVNHCTTGGCHERRSPVLTTQAQIQAHASAILDEAVYTDAMPENGTMLLHERELLGEWLACGAP